MVRTFALASFISLQLSCWFIHSTQTHFNNLGWVTYISDHVTGCLVYWSTFPYAGVKRLSDNLEEMTGKRANIFFRLCWQIVAPILITVSQLDVFNSGWRKASQQNFTCLFLLQVILIFSIIQFKPARYEDYVFPPWAQGVGWVIALASIIWIPLGVVHTLWVLPGSLMQVTYI